MNDFDLNLLGVFDALWRHRHLGHAAEELGLTQPGVSHSLKRLRDQLGDVLFVKTHGGVEPSPRAVQLAPLVRSVLETVREGILSAVAFNPKSAARTFNIALSDVGEMTFLPRLLAFMHAEAPRVDVRAVSMAPADMTVALQRGQLDLALGYFPDLGGSDIFQQRLFGSRFLCLASRAHPTINGQLTREQFIGASHAVLEPQGRSQEIVEQYLKHEGVSRRAMLSCPHFLGIPMIIGATELVVTVPDSVAAVFARVADLQELEPPFDFPKFDVKQKWHRSYHDDPGNRWLRASVYKLFGEGVATLLASGAEDEAGATP